MTTHRLFNSLNFLTIRVGEGVKKVKRGDRVYTTQTLSGAYAEYALALEHQVHPLPAKISFSQGAGVWVPYGTAYHALYHLAKAHEGRLAAEELELSGTIGMNRRAQWRKVLAFEVRRWVDTPYEELVSALRNQHSAPIEITPPLPGNAVNASA